KLDEGTYEEETEMVTETNKKPNKMVQLLQKIKHQRIVKKEFQKGMKEQGKKPKLLKQTSAILPFVQIHDDHILLKEGVMEIFQVETKNIHALNDADVADLTYAFFDESNETDLNNVEIKMHLPDKASQKDFHVFLHSDVKGELVQREDTVQYLAQVLKEGETSEMRLVYPAEQMAQMDMTKNKEKENDILAAERELAN